MDTHSMTVAPQHGGGPGSPPAPAEVAFTVVLPTHDRPELLTRALESVLAQTYPGFEVIVVDDASGPETRRAVEALGDERIVYLRNATNLGAAASRNRAIRAARGRFVAFVDDDDELLPEFLAAHAETYASSPPGVGFVWSGTYTVTDHGDGRRTSVAGVWTPTARSREEAHLLLLGYRQLGTSGGLSARRECLLEAGLFDESLRCAEDTDLLPRLALHGDFRVVPRPLVRVYHHPGDRLTSYGPAMARAYVQLLEKYRPTLEAHPRVGQEMTYKTGWLHYHAGDRRGGRRYLWRAWKLAPGRPKVLFALIFFELFGSVGPRLHQRLSTLGGWLRRRLGRRRPGEGAP